MAETTLSVNKALDVLSRLQQAAPAAAGQTLAQIADLLKQLAGENAYLNTLLIDSVPLPAAPHDPAAQAEPDAASDHLPTDILTGLNDALRAPLVAIRGRAELVQAGFLGQITAEQGHWLQAIQENADRAFAVLNTIQEMMTIQAGQLQIEPVNFISTDLLTEAWERVRDQARARQHEIIIQAADVVPLAKGDFYQSLIVLTDMLDNALRYTPEGGQIRLSVDNLGTHVLFSVADNGIGLNSDDLQNIGRPFWRGEHHRLVRQNPGTGLRLYLARHILTLQQGELIFSGEPNLGSTFSFTLPIPD